MSLRESYCLYQPVQQLFVDKIAKFRDLMLNIALLAGVYATVGVRVSDTQLSHSWYARLFQDRATTLPPRVTSHVAEISSVKICN